LPFAAGALVQRAYMGSVDDPLATSQRALALAEPGAADWPIAREALLLVGRYAADASAGRAVLMPLLENPSPSLRGDALFQLGVLSEEESALSRVVDEFTASAAIWDGLGMRRWAGLARCKAAAALYELGDRDETLAQLSLAEADAQGWADEIAALVFFQRAALRRDAGDYDGAREELTRAEALRDLAGWYLLELVEREAQVELSRANFDAAAERIDTLAGLRGEAETSVLCLRAELALGRRDVVAALQLAGAAAAADRDEAALVVSASAHLAAGEPASALAELRAALRVRDRREMPFSLLAAVLERMGQATAGGDDPARAARLLGAAEAVRRGFGAVLHPQHQPAHDDALAAVRGNAAWDEGAALSLTEAATLAFAQ
jgi:hypothetical protein